MKIEPNKIDQMKADIQKKINALSADFDRLEKLAQQRDKGESAYDAEYGRHTFRMRKIVYEKLLRFVHTYQSRGMTYLNQRMAIELAIERLCESVDLLPLPEKNMMIHLERGAKIREGLSRKRADQEIAHLEDEINGGLASQRYQQMLQDLKKLKEPA